jgi:hypothetical protein
MKKQLITLGALVGGFIIGASALVAVADTGMWSAPTANPTGNNTPAPINVGGGNDPYTYSQIKTGLIGLNNAIINSLQILTAAGTTTSTKGSVLSAIDNNGDVGWVATSSLGLSGGSSGVSKIVAGTNVTISPTTGTGAVTINATTTDNYELSVIHGASGYNLTTICRINVSTGAATCKEADSNPINANGTDATWDTTATPFSATTAGNYGLSCTSGASNYNKPICCRINRSTGTTDCVFAGKTDLSSWTSFNDPY